MHKCETFQCRFCPLSFMMYYFFSEYLSVYNFLLAAFNPLITVNLVLFQINFKILLFE